MSLTKQFEIVNPKERWIQQLKKTYSTLLVLKLEEVYEWRTRVQRCF